MGCPGPLFDTPNCQSGGEGRGCSYLPSFTYPLVIVQIPSYPLEQEGYQMVAQYRTSRGKIGALIGIAFLSLIVYQQGILVLSILLVLPPVSLDIYLQRCSTPSGWRIAFFVFGLLFWAAILNNLRPLFPVLDQLP